MDHLRVSPSSDGPPLKPMLIPARDCWDRFEALYSATHLGELSPLT